MLPPPQKKTFHIMWKLDQKPELIHARKTSEILSLGKICFFQ